MQPSWMAGMKTQIITYLFACLFVLYEMGEFQGEGEPLLEHSQQYVSAPMYLSMDSPQHGELCASSYTVSTCEFP